MRLWGAAGNGGTNDTDATNQATNAVTTAGGGSVYFPAGHYILTAAQLNSISVTTRIRGDGIGVTILDFQGTGGFPVSITGGGFTIQDIEIRGATTALEASCSEFYAHNSAFEGSHRCLSLEDVESGFTSDCLFLSLGTATGVRGDFSGMGFSNLRFLDAAQWEDGIYLNAGSANIFSDIYVGNANESAITLGTATFGNRVSNVSFKNIDGAQPVLNLGTNNYVSDQFGLGGNANTNYDARKNLIARFVWNVPPIPMGTGYYEDFNIPGASLGDQVIWGAPSVFSPAMRVQAQLVASDTLRASIINLGTATTDIDSGLWAFRVLN